VGFAKEHPKGGYLQIIIKNILSPKNYSLFTTHYSLKIITFAVDLIGYYSFLNL